MISCAGFFRELYGLDLAIRAIKRLQARYPDIGLVIMGDLNGSAPYAALISQEGLDDRVLLCGNVDHDACLTIIRQSAVFIRPTYYDGDSISVRESLALGTPVVASDTEFRPAGVTLFKKGELDDLVEKLGNVLEHRTKARTANDQAGAPRGDSANLDAIKAIYAELIA
jgi:glycosyltransferase involved in cell wall biosynthesis